MVKSLFELEQQEVFFKFEKQSKIIKLDNGMIVPDWQDFVDFKMDRL